MYLWLYNHYRLIEALHVISVICWMAGMLYLPRLFVYHAGVPINSESSALLTIMERRLLFYIMNPAMMLTVFLGIVLVFMSKAYMFWWFRIKAVLLVGILFIHALLVKYRKEFELKVSTRSPRFFKVINETITALLIFIVFLVVVKPFS